MKSAFLGLPLLVAAVPPHVDYASRFSEHAAQSDLQLPLGQHRSSKGHAPNMNSVIDAINVMQQHYFDVFSGTWPDAIDWTAAVVGTQVSATLETIVSSFEPSSDACTDVLWWQNIIDKYFAHTSFFYFGEDAFSLRNQAYDDMLWVVLGWLENVKFSDMYSYRHFKHQGAASGSNWHGLQFSPMAAHRAHIFYDLASQGWDDTLCHGGMNWNPHLTPYKNAITNELYASASIAMYLYFPGDNNTTPFMLADTPQRHDPVYLQNAIKAYKWLQESRMTNSDGLYQDGYHIKGWHKRPDGTIDPGTGECDELSTMVFTYNQGVILSASRGLWLATGAPSYLDDGHHLIESVMAATGWPHTKSRTWAGLGRGGVMEEYCDHRGQCSQDGQTFKGIFWTHMTEFCRPLWHSEEEFMGARLIALAGHTYEQHLKQCAKYMKWVNHNAAAAESSRDIYGRFGSWWTFDKYDTAGLMTIDNSTTLPPGAEDSRNPNYMLGQAPFVESGDVNDRGRGRTVETQAGGLAVLRARWNWEIYHSH
jgi:hypothetical protein